MIKRVSLVKRKAGMSVEAFHAHWMGPHMEIVRQMKNLRGLRFNPVFEAGPDGEWDGFGELWFDSVEDARAAFEAEPVKTLLGQDRPKFLGRNQVYFVTERTVTPLPESATAWSVGAGLQGKGVMVTGAAGGIGREVAKAFSTTGARVMLVDREQEAADRVLRELDGAGHVAVAADLTGFSGHEGLIRRARDELGSLYVLAHLAAVLRRRNSVDEITEEDWDYQIDTNLKAAFFLCRAAARCMGEQGRGGRIITFTSQGWWTGGFGGSVVYAASKGGITSMTRGLARTYGPHQVTVNAVSPGQARTPMLMDGLNPAVLESMTKATPLGRVAEPEEIAGTVVFLASDHARFITGATINVSGGFLMY